MEIGQPDQKRQRMGSGPWPNPPTQSRELPLPPSSTSYQHPSPFSRPEPQSRPPLDERRRHPDYAIHDPDHRRPNSGPAHGYHPSPPPPPPYSGPRDPPVKRDPSVEPLPQQYRPSSTGNTPDLNMNTPHLEDTRRYFPPFDGPPGPGASPYRTPSYPPPSPMAATPGYEHSVYGTSSLPPPREPYPGVSYPSASINTAKRKAQRAAQACDSCRTLKAKCDEGRPGCSSCREKGIECRYRDPPPKQQDKASADIMESLMRLESAMTQISGSVTQLSAKVGRVEKVLISTVPDAEAGLKEEIQDPMPAGPYQRPSVVSLESQVLPSTDSPFPSTPGQQSLPRPSEILDRSTEEEDEDDDGGDPGPPGQPSIPVNHTTGAARLLLAPPISTMASSILKSAKIKNEKYPMLQEERRGLLRLFGRGEGLDLAQGYDRDPLTDHASEGTPGDTNSDVSSPAGEEWGQLGGLTPPANIEISRGGIGAEGMPDLDRDTVLELVESYKQNMNNLHPILIPARLDMLVDSFLKSIPESQLRPKQVQALATARGPHAGFTGQTSGRYPESPGSKRKRSPAAPDHQTEIPGVWDHKPGHPFRSISTALVLLVLALGKICLHKDKLPDVLSDREYDSSWSSGSPTIRNGHPPSPLQSSSAISSSSGLHSPQEAGSRLRRLSMEVGPGQRAFGIKPRNLDVIPGLAYFALATDIIGNQLGGNSLQHVHVNILAGLYHGQLARVLESHAYIHQACRSLQVILRPKLDRFKKLKNSNMVVPSKDNPLIFAFWTCLQLESDIVAELPCPHSGILTFEDDMPHPNLQAAATVDHIEPRVLESYAAQLFLRKHLNQLHNMFYKPYSESQFPSVFAGKEPKHFPTIDAVEQSLQQLNIWAPNMGWSEADEPAKDILGARLRAKYYGAQVITYRHFVLKILEHTAEKSTKPKEQASNDFKTGINVPYINRDATRMEEIDPKALEYARNCINALTKSTTAFHGLGDPGRKRLLVTNIWGTAHAQWGNILTLQAAYTDPFLRNFIDEAVLKQNLIKTIAFLQLHAQPSSALQTDIKILKHIATSIGLLPKDQSVSASFSSNSGDVIMT